MKLIKKRYGGCITEPEGDNRVIINNESQSRNQLISNMQGTNL